jgi:putative redox protein
MYAERKEIALEGVEVELSEDRIHARDCEDCETKDGRILEIRSRIRLRGDLTDAQRKRLLQIATRCPVHRTLTSEVKIRTSEF